jgi:hypothetical protein
MVSEPHAPGNTTIYERDENLLHVLVLKSFKTSVICNRAAGAGNGSKSGSTSAGVFTYSPRPELAVLTAAVIGFALMAGLTGL